MTANRMSLFTALSAIAVLAVLSMGMGIANRHSANGSAYDQVELVRAQRSAAAAQPDAWSQIELMRAQRFEAAAAQQAYLDQRHGEYTAGVNAQAAYLEYRRGEWSGK